MRESGCDGFVAMPLDVSAFLDMVAGLLTEGAR